MKSVYQAFSESADKYPEQDFLHIPESACSSYHSGAVTLSYRNFESKVNQAIDHYQMAGLTAGSRVAVLLENRPEFFEHFFALNALGVSVVPINGEMQAEEQAYLLSHSESRLLVCLPEYLERIESVLSLCAQPPRVVACDALANLPPFTLHGDVVIDRDTECALLYTSGSTGKPKGCILSNEYFLSFGQWYRDVGGYCKLRPGEERLLTPLPLVHMNAMAVSTMGMVMSGGCIIQLDRFHPNSWWQSVVESRATAVHYLGVLPAILLSLPETTLERQHSVKFGFGAGVNPRHHRPFEERFGFALIESWAMTESGSGGCVTANQEPRHVGQCCFGKPGPTVEVKLVREDGDDVEVGEAGELLVRAKGDHPRRGFFSGYLKNREATEEGWQGNWWHTGDVVRQGEDGSLYFVDRRKNVIRRSGENIAALEVEAALAGDPTIEQCIVCAVPDEMRGDEVMALVIPRAGVELTEKAAQGIIDRARTRLSYFKLPGYIAAVAKLPLTASQKPRRADIKLLGKTLLERGDCFDFREMKRRLPSPDGKYKG